MVPPKYLAVLQTLYTRLQSTPINWALTGSTSFALQGMPVRPHDIDLQTDAAGAYQLEHLFAEFSVQKVAFSAAGHIRSHFGALVIGGIRVEIMGDIQKQLPDGSWELPARLQDYRCFVEAGEMRIPVLSLEYEYRAYLTLGRLEKAELIRQWLIRFKE